jgi:hypothetical protein
MGADIPDGTTDQRQGIIHTRIDALAYMAVAEQALADAGVEVLLHTMLATAEEKEDRVSLQLCTKTGLAPVEAGVLIDCTGDANAAAIAGLQTVRDDWMQPATLDVHAEGYNADALDYDTIQAAFDAAVERGEVQRSDVGWRHGSAEFFLREYGHNRIHICGVDATDSQGRSQAEQQGRAIAMRLRRFFRRQRGLEIFRIAWTAAEAGIRESARIVGETRLTIDDFKAGRHWPDSVCYTYYSVDIHREEEIDLDFLPDGVVPTIPLSAMRPRGSRRVIAAGRCISGDQRAHALYRVQASSMAMGQAAGAAAVLATREGGTVGDTSLDDLRSLLKEHGAIVPQAPAGT